MKTIEQYMAARAAYTRRIMAAATLAVIVSVGGLIFVMVNAEQFAMPLAIVTPPGIFILSLLVVLWVHQVTVKQLGLRCPHCGKALVGGSTEQAVVASRNCPRCGRPVVNAPPADLPRTQE